MQGKMSSRKQANVPYVVHHCGYTINPALDFRCRKAIELVVMTLLMVALAFLAASVNLPQRQPDSLASVTLHHQFARLYAFSTAPGPTLLPGLIYESAEMIDAQAPIQAMG
jgi:hypothetical protein